MSTVIFINKLLSISYEEEHRREKLQEHINSIRAMINNEANRATDPKFFKGLYEKRFRDEMRREIRVVKAE